MENKSDKAKQNIEKRGEAHKQSTKPKQETKKVFNVSGHNILERSTGKKKTYEVYQSGKLVGKADSLYGAEHIADARYSNQKKSEFNIVKRPQLRKNVSQTIPNGTILQSRDEYLHNEGDYRKPGYENKGNYRKLAVIDSNRKDELAVVKLYSESGETLDDSSSKYKPFVETLDNENKRIKNSGKVGKFIESNQKLTKHDVAKIKKDCFTNPKVRYKNKKKVRRIKGRK